MNDPRLHIAMLATPDRTRPSVAQPWAHNESVKRVYRVGDDRRTVRHIGRR
jgi:hypothetical protein